MRTMIPWGLLLLVTGCPSVTPKGSAGDAPAVDGVVDGDADTDADSDADADTDADADSGATGDTGPAPPRDPPVLTAWDTIRPAFDERIDAGPAGIVVAVDTCNAVTFSYGTPEAVEVGGVAPDACGALWATYDPDLGLQGAAQFTAWPGGPTPGGSADVADVVALDDGSALILGDFGGSVAFGATAWSTEGAGTQYARDAFVVAVDPVGTPSAWWRLHALSADASVTPSSLVVHADDSVTVVGSFSGQVELPSGEVLDRTDGSGFVVRLDASGAVRWHLQLPSASVPDAVAHGDQELVVSWRYDEGFELAGLVRPDSPQHALAVLRLDDGGDVTWLRTFETAAWWPVVHDAHVLASGGTALGIQAVDPVSMDSATPWGATGVHHLLVLDDAGEPAWSETWSLTGQGVASLVEDDAGVLWASLSVGQPAPVTFTPALQPPVTTTPKTRPGEWIQDVVLLGYDGAGALLFADLVLTGGGMPVDAALLDDGRLALLYQHYEPAVLLPATAPVALPGLGSDGAAMSSLILVWE